MTKDANQEDGAAEKDKRVRIQEVQARKDIDVAEKARLIQQIMTAGCQLKQQVEDTDDRDKIYRAGLLAFAPHKSDAERELLLKSITCGVCMDYVKRPISLACQHCLCLECLRGIRRMNTDQRRCPYCRDNIPPSMFDGARVNQGIVAFIRRLADLGRPSRAGRVVAARAHLEQAEDRPEEAFVTARAKRAGMANACSGALRMTCSRDHFGPIGPEFDPKRGRGVVVGDLYENRICCRMECAHLPHVAGISGQSALGSQSVALSGGYLDDMDEGDWFLYTGSGGKDLSGNKRNGKHNGDQVFDRSNLAIKVSCVQGYPVRVVRSYKEKRSAYAPARNAMKQLQAVVDGAEGGGGEDAKKAGRKKGRGKKVKEEEGQGEQEEEEESEDAEQSGDEEQSEEEDEEEQSEQEEEDEDEGEGKQKQQKGKGGKGAKAKAAQQEAGEGQDGEEAAAAGPGGIKIKIAKPKDVQPVRYDGVYRVLACWRHMGVSGFKVCRYLFVRCDNAPAPWSTEDTGDRPRMEIPERAQQEIDAALELGEEVTYMGPDPAWDYDEESGQWRWTRDPPHLSAPAAGKAAGAARKKAGAGKPLAKQLEAAQRELKKLSKQLADSYSCQLCARVMSDEGRRPVQTPCGHNFCLDCLKGRMEQLEQAAAKPGAARKARICTQRRPCPKARCGKDLTDFMASVRPNNTMATQAAEMEAAVKAKAADVTRLEQQLAGGGGDGDAEAVAEAEAQPDGAAEQKAQVEQVDAAPVRADSGAGTVGSDADADEQMAEAAPAEEEEEAQDEEAQQDEEEEANGTAAAALSPEPQAGAAQPSAAAGEGEAAGEAAAAAAPGQGRYRHAAVGLGAKFPDFEVAVIEGLLEDQGGDVDEVHAFLKRMARDQAAAARSPKSTAARRSAAPAGGKRKRKPAAAGRGKGKGAKSKAAEEADEEADEEVVEEEAMEEEGAEAAEEEEEEEPVVAKGRKATAGKKAAGQAAPSKRRRKVAGV